jgi:zinc finger SWIM domain-containing protein 3
MTLLLACTLDGNNEILPLAWAIVPIEDRENWQWFLKNLKESFLNIDCERMVVISDRDKGLLEALQEVLPKSYHSNYSQHIADNIQR